MRGRAIPPQAPKAAINCGYIALKGENLTGKYRRIMVTLPRDWRLSVATTGERGLYQCRSPGPHLIYEVSHV